MTRSLHDTDLSALEDELRAALRARAATTPAAGSSPPLPGVAAQPSAGRARRGALVFAVAAVVALVFGAIHLGRPTGEVRTTTAQEGPQATGDLPAAEVPRLLVEGAEVVDTEADAAYPQDGEGVEMLQAFRRPGRLDGPMIFLYTVRDLTSWGLVTDRSGDPVALRGRTGYVSHGAPSESSVTTSPVGEDRVDPGEGAGGSTTMSVDFGDGTALHLIATGLTDDELVGFVDALDRPGPADPWTSPTALQGVAEVPVAPPPADGRVYSARFTLPDPPAGSTPVEDTFEMNLYQDGFESRLADRVSSTVGPVEMVDVGGIPAAVGAYSDLDWWVMMEPEPGRTLELRIGNNRATVDWVVEHARFVDEAAWDEATAR
jgi:hypothetical protein